MVAQKKRSSIIGRRTLRTFYLTRVAANAKAH
jgi:hypothetical protein